MWGWVLAVPLLSAAGTWFARRYALRRRLIDEPGARRSHAVATPRGGGAGPVLALAILIAGLGLAGQWPGDWRWSLGGLLAVAGIGAWDDHRPLGAGVRLVTHLLAGAALATGVQLWGEPVQGVGVMLAVAVAVNVWNFMDGIDGIAATQALIVALAAAALGQSDASLRALAVALAFAAFIPFNFPRARIFLGDVGSGALGYALVLVALLTPARGSSPVALLLLFPAAAFLVDAAATLAMRMIQGERWWTPHTRHLYQAAARRYGHAPVTLAYGAWSSAGVVLAWALRDAGESLIMASLALWYTAAAGLWACVQRVFGMKRGGMTETDR
jgi:UDP-N-acetylmuramyl pentapeptide phosphotransferase/UDP-N-acetylglucosamine-1-phosphate transferase